MVAAGLFAVGFIGFGEAGSTLAAGLRDGGLERFSAFDIAWETPPRADLIRQRAEATGVDLVPDPAGVTAASDVIVSAVVCTESLTAAEMVAPALRPGQWYLDINSVTAGTKRRAAAVVSAAGGRYVDVAVMANASRDLSRMPMLLAGEHAADLCGELAEAGLQTRVVGARPGEAAQIKMFRSVLVKGMEAVVLEAMLASYPEGAHEQVLESVEDTFGQMTFPEFAAHMIGRHAVHGERRANEMLEVAEALEEVGVEPIMARAAYQRLSGSAATGLHERFRGGEDPDWRAALDHLVAARGPATGTA